MPENRLPAARPVTRFADDMPGPRRRGAQGSLLSIIVVAYAMPEQLDRTLHSLSLDYQQSVAHEDYEVIVVENASGQDLGEARATAHRGQFRYFLREETEPTPIHAINFGVEQARGDFVAIMIDGARMLTPGVVAWTLAALDLHDEPVICVPGYHLGEELQQVAARKGYNEAREASLLASIAWPEDGYRLFDISCSAGTSAGGFFKPIGESNCIAMSRALFNRLGGFDTAFRQRGGGLVNLDFYKRALEAPDTGLVILPGEGSFHQFHGGETTGKTDIDRDQALYDMQAEYLELRGERFSPPQKRATFLGPVPDSALRYLRRGAESVMRLNGLADGEVRGPLLSIVVVAYQMPEQLRRTLFTLSAGYQRNVTREDYEVIVVENHSDQMFDPGYLDTLEGDFRYFPREEAGKSPVHALNFGLRQARGQQVGIMIDGAHMITPRVLEFAIKAGRAYPEHLVSVPVYHLGHDEQNTSAREGFDEDAQDRLLESVDWRANGYQLLDISVWCGANPNGQMTPMMESNCYFVPRTSLVDIGYADERFDDEGGGALNLHLYRALGLTPGSEYVVLHGEGSFHQFHGGVTSDDTREAVQDRFFQQLQAIWQDDYRVLTREPIHFGSVTPQAQRHLSEASRRAERRYERLGKLERAPWPETAVADISELPFLDPD